MHAIEVDVPRRRLPFARADRYPRSRSWNTAQVLAGTFAILEGEVFAIESGTLYQADATIGGWIQVVLGWLLLLAGAVRVAQLRTGANTTDRPTADSRA